LSPFIRGNSRPLISITRVKVEELVLKHVQAGNAEHVSVYFQSLATGYWFGISEYEKFIPASLLKLPLAMGIMARASTDKTLLGRRLPLADTGTGPTPEIPPRFKLQPGRSYSVGRLIKQMLVTSDNSASTTLVVHFSHKPLLKVLKDFGLAPDNKETDFITVKQYMMMLLSLYNSTYLDADSSQTLLGYLSQSEYADGIAAGLPHGVPVAHKFGEREIYASTGLTGVKQLHDCGIVYYSNATYLLGVMTRGKDLKKQGQVVRDVSALIYKEVSTRYEQRN